MNAKIIKSDNLYFASQPFDFNGKIFLSMSVGFGFSLTAEPKILPIDKAFATAVTSLQNGECFDMGSSKMYAEFLVAGSAFTPNNTPNNEIAVKVSVGDKSRILAIKSKNKNHTFTQQLLSWKNTAYDEKYNPLGYKEFAKLDDNAVYISDLDNENIPANLSPTGLEWNFRKDLLGKKYDKQWLQQKWRSVADDFSFEFFNLSQPNSSQRLDLHQYFVGNTNIELSNLNQNKAQISTRIPEKFLENQIIYKDGKQISADFKADTLWLFPNQEIGILLFHSNVETNNTVAENISEIHLQLTPEDAPEVAPEIAVPEIPVAEVAAVAAKGAAVAGIAAAVKEDNSKKNNQNLAENLPNQQNQQNQENKQDENPNVPPSLTLVQKQAQAKADFLASLNEVNEGLQRANQPPLTAEQIAEVQKRLDEIIAVQDKIENTKVEPKTPEQTLRELGIDEKTIQGIRKLENLQQPNPEDFKGNEIAWKKAVEEYIQKKEEILPSSPQVQDLMRQVLLNVGPGGIEDKGKAAQQNGDYEPKAVFKKLGLDPKLLDKIEEHSNKIPDIESEAYPAYVKQMEKDLGFAEGSMSKQMILVHQQVKKYMQQSQIAKKNNENLVENQQNPQDQTKQENQQNSTRNQEKILETPQASAKSKDGENALAIALAAGGAALVGINLAGADLKGKNFADQDLRGVDFSGADLQNADFSRSNLENVKFSNSKIDEATFYQSNLNNAKMDNVSAKETDFSEANISNLNLEKSNLQQAKFYKNNAENLNVSNANCAESRWQFCDLKNANLQNSKLHKADFHQSNFVASNFDNCDLQECSFAFQSCAEQSSFKNANLNNAVFENSKLNNANFDSIKANNTRFADCDLADTNFANSQAKNSYFTRSNLVRSKFNKADLMYADLSEVNNAAADFSNSSLFGADLYKFDEDKALNLDSANTQRTIIEAKK